MSSGSHAHDAERIGYLTSRYPGISHTFISREVDALRARGLHVDTFSVRKAYPEELVDDDLVTQERTTFTIFRQAPQAFLWALITEFFRGPVAWSKTLRRALAHRVPGTRGFIMAFAYFLEALVLASELRRRGTSRLHNHFANTGATVGYLAAGLLGIPWSFTIHGISETDYPAGLLLAGKIEAAEFVACVSYFGRAQAMRLTAPEHWSKLHVVRCGLALQSLPQHAAARNGRRIICVGRLSPEKGQAGLLKAYASLVSERPDVQLIFVGDGPEGERLRETAATLGIAAQVEFAGRLGEQDTLERIASADILVLPSFMEGLPIVLMEAMAMGTAVVASRIAGVPELVEDGKSGLLFTPSNWDELAKCLRVALDDDALREMLARNARAVIEKGFDIARSAAQLEQLFENERPK